MNIEFSKLEEQEIFPLFVIFKTYMKPIIENAIGWNEQFQRESFTARLQPEWFNWILCNGEKVGLICKRRKESSLHLHLLIIFSNVQRSGIGSLVVEQLKVDAQNQQLDLTLSCFKNNEPAVMLYRQQGFVVSTEDEHFYDFIISSAST